MNYAALTKFLLSLMSDDVPDRPLPPFEPLPDPHNLVISRSPVSDEPSDFGSWHGPEETSYVPLWNQPNAPAAPMDTSDTGETIPCTPGGEALAPIGNPPHDLKPFVLCLETDPELDAALLSLDLPDGTGPAPALPAPAPTPPPKTFKDASTQCPAPIPLTYRRKKRRRNPDCNN